MGLTANLRRLWRHGSFRRLVRVRVASQAADGTLQVGMASYVLFSPTSQPDAWSVAGVLAVTLLPFSLVGPFLGIVLDRFSRRQVVVVVDSIRCALAVVIAALVATGDRSPGLEAALFCCLLVAMSLNRFAMAGLTAGLAYTVDEDELLTASSIVPTIGPLGLVVGAVIAGGGRVALASVLPPHLADAVVFCLAATLFIASVALALRIPRAALGPAPGGEQTAIGQVFSDLADALRHLGFVRTPGQASTRSAMIGRLALLTMAAQRFVFGFIFVATLLGFRNQFNAADNVAAAMADLSLWAGLTGVGFVSATIVVPVLTRRFGIRRTIIAMLMALAVVQLVPGSIFARPALLAAGFLIGCGTQCFKICIDTLLQAHVDPEYKGRAFVVFDVLFNLALVSSAVLAALVLPPTGLALWAFFASSAAYLGLALVFARSASRIGAATFELGR